MADAPTAASLLSVLSQLPADVVDTNIMKIIGHVGMCSLMLCSRETATVVRRSRSTLTLGTLSMSTAAGGEPSLQQVQHQSMQLGLYTSVHALALLARNCEDVELLMVGGTAHQPAWHYDTPLCAPGT